MLEAQAATIFPFMLLYVGFNITTIGLWMHGIIENKSLGVLSTFTSFLQFATFVAMVQLGFDYWYIAKCMLFAGTYLLCGICLGFNLGVKVLGWWCYFVSLVAPFPIYECIMAGDWRFAIIWFVWGALWHAFWWINCLESKVATKITQWVLPPAGFGTAFLPALMMLVGVW